MDFFNVVFFFINSYLIYYSPYLYPLSRSGSCSCRAGYVDWKWECHPLVGLGDPCITSAQCRSSPSQLCNPISHKCSCQRGFSPVLSTNYGLQCQQVSTKVCSAHRG